MFRKEQNEMAWLEFELLQPYPRVVHGVFLRQCLASDPSDKVKICLTRQKIQQVLGISSLAYAHQVHGSDVKTLKELEEDDRCDGIITDQRGAALVIKHADCQAAIFFDPIKQVIANVHSGWKGSVANIYQKTIQSMSDRFGSYPSDLIVCISPSLGPDHSEFVHFEKELPASFLPFQHKPFYFDFWQVTKHQLKELGVLEKNIEIAAICTYCHENDFFSYRRDKALGRNITVVGIK